MDKRPRFWLITLVAFLFGCYFPAVFVTPEQPDHKEHSRRQLLPLLGLACLPLAPNSCDAEAIWRSLPAARIQDIQDAYPGRFVAYLTRFLLNFDSDFQELWKATKEGEVSLGNLESQEFQRNARFARFSRTVQLSLLNYPPDKSRTLLEVLLKDYGITMEAKRQICILFSLLQGPQQQPVAELRTLLRQVENASIAQVDIVDPGAFVFKEQESNETEVANVSKLELKLPAPAGIGGISAVVFAQLRPTNGSNGSFGVDSVVVTNKGCGYAKDMSLVPKVVLPADLKMLRAPNLTVQLTRPARLARMREKEAPPDQLKSKMTNLLPLFLLPVYNAKLDRLVPDQSLPLTPDPTPPEEGRRLDEVFGTGRQVDRFRADFVFAEFDSTYGPVGISPLERERQLFPSDYFRLMASGALASVVRTILFLPVQTVKVRMQTNPDLGQRGFIPALKYVATSEPSSNLFRGIDVAVMFSATFGFFSFGIKEYLSRELVIQFPGLNELFAVILASIASVVITLFFATPWEVLTTKIMASNDRYWGFGLLKDLVAKNFLKAAQELYEEYWLLTSKELAFVTTKFLIFDSLREALLFFVPAFVEAQRLLIACLCGALAGACGAITSHPIDTLFALRTTGGGKDIPSLDKLFRGVGARVLIYSPGIALTFLVYDAAKTYLGVGGSALMQTLDLLRP